MDDTLGSFIKKLRQEKGISGRELARRSEISQAYLSQLETGQNENPTHQVLEKLARGLEVPYIKLLEATGYLGRTEANTEVRQYMLKKVEDVINMLTVNNKFLEQIADDLQALENKYNGVLEVGEKITPEWVKSQVLNAEYDSEWIYDLIIDLQNISKKHNLDLELKTFLLRDKITYNGQIIKDKEKHLITAYLDGLFSNRE